MAIRKITVNIKKLYNDAKIPTYESTEAACADLYAYLPDDMEGVFKDVEGNKCVVIPAHGTVKISSGFAAELPKGYCALIYARSGLATKSGLAPANKVGICDADYRGPYIVPIHNHSNAGTVIRHNDRIAQVMFVPCPQASFNEVETLTETERGEGGFGSTGKN